MTNNMRYIKIVLVSAFVLGLTQTSRAQHIAGSKHDFSDATNAAWNQGANLPTTSTTTKAQLGGQICAPCHAPHTYSYVKNGSSFTSTLGGSPTGTPVNAPLWNHTMSTANYQTYTGYNMKAVVGQPDGATKLCLSCHDGTVALSYYRTFPSNGQTSTTTMATVNNGASLLGTDLRNEHPVSFVYNAALASADGKLFDPTTTVSGLPGGGYIDGDLLDANHELQCTSCHDPHNNSGAPHMLVKSNTASALCLTCHNK